MIYLLLGEGVIEKDQKIEEIKGKLFKTEEARKFDFELLHSTKLSAAELKKSLISLPAIAKKRLIVLRDIQKLTLQNKKIIQEFIEQDNTHVDIVFEIIDSTAKNVFITYIKKGAKIFQFQQSMKLTVFDMTKAMQKGDTKKSLKLLHDLLEDGQHPLQLMGGLVWFWGSNKVRVSADVFKKGLLDLQEADLNIKRSRIQPEHAIEILVMKLNCLIAY